MRQPIVRSYAVTHPTGSEFSLPQSEAWHQLIYAKTGVLRVITPGGTWTLPPHRAGWVPAGVTHGCEAATRATLRTLYVRASVWPQPWPIRILDLVPAAREVLLTMVARAPWFEEPNTLAYLTVLQDQLEAVRQLPVLVPAPRCRACRVAARRVMSQPQRRWTTAGLAEEVGMSKRTLERHFSTEVGMGVGRWITLARLAEALRLLAQGVSVGEAAVRAGYSTQSAFGAMFKTELGVPPGQFFQAR